MNDEIRRKFANFTDRISEFEKYNRKSHFKIDSKIKTEDWANEWKNINLQKKLGKTSL